MDNLLDNRELTIQDFEYELPDELVAQRPAPVRHGSRLLRLDRQSKQYTDSLFEKLPELLQPGDLLVVNDTRVIPARLYARRQTGALIEILLLRPDTKRSGLWLAMAAPLRKLRQGEQLILEGIDKEGIDKEGNDKGSVLIESLVATPDGQRRVMLDFGSNENVYKILSSAGHAPLPPYIKRDGDNGVTNEDLQRYQTIFAAAPGAVAAPTAGLHFSPEVMQRLEERGVQSCRLTLHVGAGTFKPITGTLADHFIEAEQFTISQGTCDAVNRALDEQRRVIAVGTTSCRALETAGASGRLRACQDERTELYIKPGFQFRIITGLLTNFHLSRSSLLVLVSAFGGYDTVMNAYKHAVQARYRFYSYGDAMLIT